MNYEIGKIKNGYIEKEYFRQGYVYKNYENFKNKNGICYLSEYQGYKDLECTIPLKINEMVEGKDYETYNTIFETCKEILTRTYEEYEKIDELTEKDIELFAITVFEDCDWQHISSLATEYAENWFE